MNLNARLDVVIGMGPVHGSGRVASSRAYRASTRSSTGWLRVYTRRLDPRLAAERASELTFELWEHAMAAERRGWPGPFAAADLVARTAVGVPRDWAWRHAVLADGWPPATGGIRLVGRRHRLRYWVPLQSGRPFDQTNGTITPETALPHEPGRDSWGAAGNAFGAQGGF